MVITPRRWAWLAASLWDVAAAATLVAHGPELGVRALPDGPERLALEQCEPEALMQALADRGCNRVLWECGPELAAVALRQGCIQEVAAVIATKLMGGVAARTPLGDLDLESMVDLPAGVLQPPVGIGEDWLMRFRLRACIDSDR